MNATITTICLLFLAIGTNAQTVVSTLVNDGATPFTDDLIEDASGNLYCADYSGDAVFKRTPSGVVSTFVSGLNTPNGLAFNSAGELYVCDNIGSRIYTFDATGAPLDTIVVSNPSGIIKDVASDTMIFTTYGSVSTLKKLAPDGTIYDFHAGGEMNGPVGLEYCQGELYVANFNNRKIFRVEDDTVVYITELPGSGSLGFLAVADDKLLATAFNGQRIYSIDPIAGEVNIYAGSTFGGTDGALDSAKFTTPNGIYVNGTMDSIYVSEYNTGKLRLITGFTLAVPELSIETNVQLFPNPSNATVTVQYNAEVPFDVILATLDGKELIQKSSGLMKDSTLDLTELTSGAYLVQIRIAGSVVAQERLIRY
ncbi:MAG: hypothetical protein Crog4KO_29490 [Crocinitomicaceae bacterium]